MPFRPRNACLLFLAIGMSLCGVEPARAALGGDPASVLADAAELQGVDHALSLRQYDIHEITADSGLSVREFVSRDGIVFAVTWTGPVMPNLQTLLGAHFPAYTAALAQVTERGLRRSLRIETSGLVVEAEGHMRAYVGRAYLRAVIPAGTPTSDLR